MPRFLDVERVNYFYLRAIVRPKYKRPTDFAEATAMDAPAKELPRQIHHVALSAQDKFHGEQVENPDIPIVFGHIAGVADRVFSRTLRK